MADKHIMETVVKLAGAVDPSLGKATNNATKALGNLDMKAVGMKVAFAGAAIIAVKAIADREHIDMPICQALYKVIFEKADIEKTIRGLFDRSLKKEFDSIC